MLDRLVAVSVLLHRRRARRDGAIDGQVAGYRPTFGADWVVSLDDVDHRVRVEDVENGVDVELDGRLIAVRGDWRPGQHLFRGSVNGRDVVMQADPEAEGYRLHHGGVEAMAKVRTPRAAELAALMPVKAPPDTSKYLLCPMPGLVVSVAVSEGEEVKAGQALAVVEAMKMENILRAERDGVIAALKAAPGDSLAVDDVILEFE